MSKREVERTALTELELQALSAKKFAVERLGLVRDIFLFSCYSGLAYSDLKKLRSCELIIGIDGEKLLISKRQKTDITAKIPILPQALRIVDSYENDPQCILKDEVLPVLSNQKINAYLKEIADMCGINKNLTYYIARHTFATTVNFAMAYQLKLFPKCSDTEI